MQRTAINLHPLIAVSFKRVLMDGYSLSIALQSASQISIQNHCQIENLNISETKLFKNAIQIVIHAFIEKE